MKFSTRTLYGLRAVFVLASRFGQGSLPVSQIAKKENLSVAYLEQILNALKKKGIVKSVRGPQGGYVLARKPSEISLETLFYTLAEKRFPELGKRSGITPEMDEAAVANFIFWKKLRSFLDQGLAAITLQQLLDEARRLKKNRSATPHYAFHI